MAHCSATIYQQVTLSGDDEWPKVADAMIEAGFPPVSLRPSEEPEPGRHDGGARCSPWVGSHLPGLRRVPASCEGRADRAASARCRGFHHTGAAPLPLHVGTLERFGFNETRSCGGTVTCWAIAHRKARHARAMATTP